MFQPLKPILPPPVASRSRVRLSNILIQALGWTYQVPTFECFGFFRQREELVCAPSHLVLEDGDHPFGDVLRTIDAVQNAQPLLKLPDIPPARALVAAERMATFQASWTTAARTQLDLNLGVAITDRLGWSKNPSMARPIYIGALGGIFIAMSEKRYLAAQEEPLE